ncbi:DUF1428 domain-containing protein [Bdellovibrio sp. 22V]|uniref:DUF1428 domain-containing protein n=1 Tax=Bdellovibrio TaxID=958 RepID=UPI00254315D3|nr:DUF1428 domain-containing protein [Bdellovibrio sp. 22V]WII70850.1 DUF1428 domain-containing protein [Bdellovibrio sp. 22V]
MAKYVDGFVIAVPKKNVKAYQAIAKKAGKVWMEYGALEYFECVGEDMQSPFGVPFPRLAKLKPNETVIFSWIVYKSKAHRDRVNAKVMKDPRIMNVDPKSMPFDIKRMSHGGFDVLVEGK